MSKKESDYSLHNIVVDVVQMMNVEKNIVWFWISLYAKWNMIFHSDLKDHIAQIKWEKLTAYIKINILNIVLIMSEVKKNDHYQINKIINYFQILYFKSVFWDVDDKVNYKLTECTYDIQNDYQDNSQVQKQQINERTKVQKQMRK